MVCAYGVDARDARMIESIPMRACVAAASICDDDYRLVRTLTARPMCWQSSSVFKPAA
jgi:hypothetical protein